jgi:Flp pilus assembly protein TadB
MPKKAVSSKVSLKTDEKLEEISDEKGISKSELLNRYIRQSIEIEEEKKEVRRVETDGSGEVEETLDQTQQTLQRQSKKIDEQQSIQASLTGLNLVLTLSIFWLGIHIILSVPSIVTVGTGAVLVGCLVYTYYQYWRD